MRTRKLVTGIVGALAAVTMQACIYSENPVAAGDGCGVDPRLVGSWSEVGGSARFYIVGGQEAPWPVLGTEDGVMDFDVHEITTARVGGVDYLNVRSRRAKGRWESGEGFTVFRYVLDERGALTLYCADPDRFGGSVVLGRRTGQPRLVGSSNEIASYLEARNAEVLFPKECASFYKEARSSWRSHRPMARRPVVRRPARRRPVWTRQDVWSMPRMARRSGG